MKGRKKITQASVDALWSGLQRGPLPPRGQTGISCLGCGKHVTVAAGHEREADAEMKHHVLSHERQLSKEFLTSAKHDRPTNNLIARMMWGMTAEEIQN